LLRVATSQIAIFPVFLFKDNQKARMATITLDVQDKKLKFFKELMNQFSFVKIREEEPEEDTDEQVIANIREGVRQMRLVEQGKMKATPFKDFLKELDEL
jgi:hypothetical protein